MNTLLIVLYLIVSACIWIAGGIKKHPVISVICALLWPLFLVMYLFKGLHTFDKDTPYIDY